MNSKSEYLKTSIIVCSISSLLSILSLILHRDEVVGATSISFVVLLFSSIIANTISYLFITTLLSLTIYFIIAFTKEIIEFSKIYFIVASSLKLYPIFVLTNVISSFVTNIDVRIFIFIKIMICLVITKIILKNLTNNLLVSSRIQIFLVTTFSFICQYLLVVVV